MKRARNPARPQTLRALLARGHLLLVLLAVVMATLSVTVSGVIAIRGYAARNLELAGEAIAYTVEPALVFGDHETAARLVERLARNNNLASLSITDPEGRPIVSWHEKGRAGTGQEEVLAAALLGKVERDMHYQGQRLGTIRAVASLGAIRDYVLVALIVGACCLGITVLATRILARQLEARIIEPLEQVGDITNEVIQNRQLSLRLTPPGIAEMDRFMNDFNDLLTELERWNRSLWHENRELSRKAERDSMTGLGNRAAFERGLEQALARFEREGQPFLLLYCDCNGFKAINDTHGHDIGDAILGIVAEGLRTTGDPDRVFRLGGDEFALLIDDSDHPRIIGEIKRQVGLVATHPISARLTVPPQLGIAVGHALCPQDGRTASELVRVADQRMYQDKKGADRS